MSDIVFLLVEDIDECSGGTPCGEGVCNNTYGNYTCDCHEGWEVKGDDSQTCVGE